MKEIKAKKMDVHFSSEKQDWATPEKLFDQLNAKYGPLELDVCATQSNRKCPTWLGQQTPDIFVDGLTTIWSMCSVGFGNRQLVQKCWMNPPYGREIKAWVKKASDEAAKGCTVVCLLPARLGSRWMRDLIKKPLVASKNLKGWTDELGDWIEGDTLIVGELAGRVKFGGATTAAPFPSMVVIFKPAA